MPISTHLCLHRAPMLFHSPSTSLQTYTNLFAAWGASASLHYCDQPATGEEITAAEEILGGPLIPDLRALYEASDGLRLFQGSLNIVPLFELVTLSDQLREWHWPIPDELLMFGDNGGDEQFGLWLPQRSRTQAPVPVIEEGEVFEPNCMAVAATSFVRFLIARTAYHLMGSGGETGALDFLGVPSTMRSDDPNHETLTALVQWADPELVDPSPD